MNKIKLFVMAAALVTCTTASAQFSNTSTRNNKRTSRTSMGSSNIGDGPETGYKVFVDAGYTIGLGDYAEGALAISTTHGYQFNPHLFAGVGVGLAYYTDSDVWALPIFADLRFNLTGTKNAPYVGFKVGYTPTDIEGFYLSPSVGYRFGFDNDMAFNVSIGYELQMADYYTIYYSGYYDESKENIGGLSLRIGLEF